MQLRNLGYMHISRIIPAPKTIFSVQPIPHHVVVVITSLRLKNIYGRDWVRKDRKSGRKV
ncbi:hypothetical protein PAXRUDRAFT_829056, partial [Paxillus rubicundulus Ve08.2h10]